jgi:hypothetical protein
MSDVDLLKERLRLEALYVEKSDEELLNFQADYRSLTGVAQSVLCEELHKRKLWSDDLNHRSEAPPVLFKADASSAKFLREAGSLLLNLIAPVFGTALIEAPFDRLYHPHTLRAVLLKGYIFSAVFAFALGFFVFRRWKPGAAKWTALWGIGWFAVGVCLDVTHGSVWSRMSGTACSEGLRAAHCMNWFIFSLPAVRTVFYSAGAWLCLRLAAYGKSALENAFLARFQLPSNINKAD